MACNCIYLPADELLRNGFSTGHGSLRPPTTIGTAATQIAIMIQSDQNDMFGGQAIPNFDYALAPYVARSFVRNVMLWLEVTENADKTTLKKSIERPLVSYINQHTSLMNEKGYEFLTKVLEDAGFNLSLDEHASMIDFVHRKTDNDTYQAMEGLVHNLCTLQSRAGSQTPFSSINFGTDTTTEGRMVIRNILLATDAGLGNGETAIFPISIFRMRKGITDKGSPNYDLFKLACKVSAKRLFPEILGAAA